MVLLRREGLQVSVSMVERILAHLKGQGRVFGRGNPGDVSDVGYQNLSLFLESSSFMLQGDLNVSGTLSKGAGSFRIDDPLDPKNKYLQHSFVESPDMMDIYNGVATFDESGKAHVELPNYFEALNRDFRYQLTPIGAFAPLYIEKEIKDNHFTIAGGENRMRVSWQVTGIGMTRSPMNTVSSSSPRSPEERRNLGESKKSGTAECDSTPDVRQRN